MSKLLIEERPLQVLPSLVIELGNTDKAIMLQQVHYWLQKSTNVKDGHKWVYNSVREWQKQFPWLSEKTVQRYLLALEKDGWLITGNYNKYKFDRTKWYRVNYDKLGQIEQAMDTAVPTSGRRSTETMDTAVLTNTIDYTETTTEINGKDGGGGNYIYIAGQPIDKLHDSGILNGDQIRYLYAVDSAVIGYINRWAATANQNKVAYAIAIIKRLMNDGIMTAADVDSNKYTSKQPPRVEPDELPNIDIIKLYD